MTTIATNTTLGDLVTAHPELAGELERRGLDYCCGGARTLADACGEAGLDPAAVAGELTAEASTRPTPEGWATFGAAELVDHLEATHHAYLNVAMPRLSALLAKINGVHGERHPELAEVAGVFEELRADLEPHLVKEERVLFPMIRELAAARTAPAFHCGTLRNPISVMLREHETVGALLERLRTLTDGYRVPADGCASYTAAYEALARLEADTHLHVHKENNVLFPLVARLEAALAPDGAT